MSVLPESYDKYIRFFKLILKYYDDDIFNPELRAEQSGEEEPDWDHDPEELVEDLKKMGPTYVKFGQFLSTRADLLPKPFLTALASLQDDVEAVDYQVVEEIFKEQVGVRISKAFASFEKEPMASASIGQVHKAVLHSGKQVAVKIQRPGIAKRFNEDLDVLMTLTEKVEQVSKASKKFALHDTIEELRYILLQELNYRQEAENLLRLKKNLAEFHYLQVPGVIQDYSAEKVLTMEYIAGHKVTDLSPFQLENVPREKLLEDFLKGYLKQIIVDGFAHADPHPGNIEVTKEGKLALLDLGMVARFDGTMRENILRLMVALGQNDGEELTHVLLKISSFDEDKADKVRFKKNILRKLEENREKNAGELQNGRTIMEINKIAARHGIRMPVELVSLGKILLNMDQILSILGPDYRPQKAIRSYTKHLMQRHMLGELKTTNLIRNVLESKELLENLPYRLNKISEDLANQNFQIKMDIEGKQRFIVVFQKVANRISVAVVTAALILGGALILRIPTQWTIFGYSGFAIIIFVIAILIGFRLVYQILFTDENE